MCVKAWKWPFAFYSLSNWNSFKESLVLFSCPNEVSVLEVPLAQLWKNWWHATVRRGSLILRVHIKLLIAFQFLILKKAFKMNSAFKYFPQTYMSTFIMCHLGSLQTCKNSDLRHVSKYWKLQPIMLCIYLYLLRSSVLYLVCLCEVEETYLVS